MDDFTPAALEKLLADGEGLRLSLYMPTHPRDGTREEDRLRLKNLLNRARKVAEERAPGDRGLLEKLEEARGLLPGDGFWSGIGKGLVLFLQGDAWSCYRVPIELPELLVWGEDFHLIPLLPLLAENGAFHLLTLSRDRPRLLRCTRFECEEVELSDLPGGLEETLGNDWEQASLQFHTRAGPGDQRGERSAMFHGHGAGVDDEDTDLMRYFRRVDESVGNALPDPSTPVLLMGVEPLPPAFRSVTSLGGIVEEEIRHNPQDESDDALREMAWEFMAPRLLRPMRTASERFHQSLGTGLATNDPHVALPAARFSRVDTLWVARGVQLRGRVQGGDEQVLLEENPDAGSQDLLNRAALATLRHGGTVYAVPGDEVPGEGALAALLRY